VSTSESQKHRQRCERECTRDVIFLLQVRRTNIYALPDGCEFNDGPVRYEDEDGNRLPEPIEVSLDELRDAGGYVFDYWDTESVWLDRDEAEAFAKAHEYNYCNGWRVYGMPSYGDLAAMLRGQE
jgi:hypothetical protein